MNKKIFIFIIFLFLSLKLSASINKKILDIISLENNSIDILELSLNLSKEVLPDVKTNKYLTDIKKMVREISKVIKKKDDPFYKIGVINDYLYKEKDFNYDMDDMGARLEKNQFITGYLDSKEGSCITMPLLFYILGTELDLPVKWVRAPDHFFCRYYVDENTYINIESTSGGKTALDETYIEDFMITEEEVNKRVYMYSLSERECAGDLLCITGVFFARQKELDKAIDYFNTSLMLDPDNPFTYRFLSLIYKHLGDMEKSKDYLEKAFALGYKKVERE